MDAALFDLDGTLVLTEARSRLLWAAVFELHGVEADDDLLDQFVGRRGREVLREMPHLFPGRDPDSVTEEVWEYEDKLDLPPVRPVPGAVELTGRIEAAGVPLALVTSARRPYAEDKLAAIDLADRFGVMVTGDDVMRGKPDPEGYLIGCARLGVGPAGAVAFEDSPAGVKAAKGAGLYCVAVSTSVPPAELAAADEVVADLSEVSWPPAGGGRTGSTGKEG
ncbi:MAG: HAD-IA family hydrolase [Streptosporangiales bacterium]|nr:HAD-IA family hydrolase [Streptosporangiales bacterium]